MSRRSVRFRLTGWYLTALSLGICLFGSIVWAVMREQMLRNRNEGIDKRLVALGEFLELEARDSSLEAIREEAREYSTGLPSGNGLRVLDQSGRVLFERAPAPGEVLVRSREVQARGMKFTIELSAPLDDFYRTLSLLRWVLLGSLPLVLLLAGGMGWWLAGRALIPVDSMTREAKAISTRDLSARLALPGTGDELQRLGEAWNELLGRIEASMKAVTRFTADAAHELRTPLAVIRTASEIALRQGRTAESYRKTIEAIHRETASMTDLVEQLLLLAREDSGQWQFRFDAIRLGDVLRELRETLAPAAREKEIALEWTLPREEPLVWADPDAIRRLVLILVDNALKYTDSNGEVRVTLSSGAESAAIEVSDNGCGIEPRHLPHVFERFYRADPARTAGSGAGLGLSIAKTIADAHRARIELQSQPGRGTTAVVSIPVFGQDDPLKALPENPCAERRSVA